MNCVEHFLRGLPRRLKSSSHSVPQPSPWMQVAIAPCTMLRHMGSRKCWSTSWSHLPTSVDGSDRHCSRLPSVATFHSQAENIETAFKFPDQKIVQASIQRAP
eukprot:6329409-Amphidinium_carterae.1